MTLKSISRGLSLMHERFNVKKVIVIAKIKTIALAVKYERLDFNEKVIYNNFKG